MKFTHSMGRTIYRVGEHECSFFSSEEKPGTKFVIHEVVGSFWRSFRAVVDDFGSLVRV